MLKIYRMIWEVLGRHERRNAVLLMLLTIFMGIFEVVGVAVVLPFLQVLADPSVIERNVLLAWAWRTFGFTSETSFGVFVGACAFAVIVAGMVVRAVTTYALIRFAMMRVYSLSSRLLRSYLKQTYGWFLIRNSASLGQTLLYETDKAIHDCLLPALMLFSHLVVTILIAGFVFVVEPVVAIAATGALAAVYALVYLGFRGMIDRYGNARIQANEERFRLVQEATGGIKEVKLQHLEDRFVDMYRAPARVVARMDTRSQTISKLPRFALEAVVYGGFIVMVLAMLVRSDGGIVELLPLFGLIGMAGIKLFPALQQIYVMMSAMRYMAPALAALHQNLITLNVEDNDPSPGKSGEALRLVRALDLKDVRFRYPGTDRDTLNGLSLTIPARKTVGIVGGTGAGKTTTIDLILGLFAPDGGEIRVDGVVLDRTTTAAWQSRLGYVPQAIYLSDNTVAGNIAFGIASDQIDMKAVERAARIANLHDFVVGEMPEGYATIVGERGVRLSGGQRQRIGIARALYHDPDVLILDEATSALDNLTEKAVMDAVHNLGHDKTIIMIAHRLSTVEGCDTIFLLERGRLAAEGTFADLVASNETFRRMAGESPDQDVGEAPYSIPRGKSAAS
jgi:ABC-type multidrug transport system fused ATPase/permease subunit